MTYCKADIEIAVKNKFNHIVVNSIPNTTIEDDIISFSNVIDSDKKVELFNTRLSNLYGEEYTFLTPLGDNKFKVSIPNQLIENELEHYTETLNQVPDYFQTEEFKASNPDFNMERYIHNQGKFGKTEASQDDSLMPSQYEKEETFEADTPNLMEFFYKLNPDFKFEHLENLSDSAKSYISKFLIQYRTLEDIPEEAAHFFFELLPDGPFKNEMLRNISRFEIYQTTLEKYKTDSEYINKDGSINYDKIKHEAVAKLITEYIFALNNNDQGKLQQLQKKNFSLKEWIRGLFTWLIKGYQQELLTGYRKAAQMILDNDVSLLDISLAKEKGIFKKKSEFSKTASFFIVDQIKKSDNIKSLKSTLNKVRKELKNITKVIDSSSLKQKLNNALEAVHAPKIEVLLNDINKIKVNKYYSEANELLSLTNSFDDFINVISDFQKIYEGIEYILSNDEFSNDFFENIKELQTYRKTYSKIISLFDNELQTLLEKSNLKTNDISQIMNVVSKFRALDGVILNKLKSNIKGYILENFEGVNEQASLALQKEIKELEKDPINNSKVIEKRQQLLNNTLITEKFVDDLLNGLGQDMSAMSSFSYNVTAAVKNGDVTISKLANILADQRKAGSVNASSRFKKYKSKIQDLLDSVGLDVYKLGNILTQAEERIDKIAKEGKRTVLTFLNPHKNITFERQRLEKELDSLRTLYEKEPTEENKQNYHTKRIEILDFNYNYMNNGYKGEYKNFRYKWAKNNLFYESFTELNELNTSIALFEKQYTYANDEVKEQIRFNLIDIKSKRAELFSTDNKTGDELEKAQLLNQYFQELSKFNEIDVERTEQKIESKLSILKNDLIDLFEELGKTTKNGQVSYAVIKSVLQNKFGNDFNFELEAKQRILEKTSDWWNEDSEISIPEETSEFEIIINVILKKVEDNLVKQVPNEQYQEEVLKRGFERLNKLQSKNDYTLVLEEIRKLRTSLLKPVKNEFSEPNLNLLPEDQKQLVITLDRLLMTYSDLVYLDSYEYPDSVSQKTFKDTLLQYLEESKNGNQGEASKLIKKLNQIKTEVKTIFSEEIKRESREEKERYEEIGDVIGWMFSDSSETLMTHYYWEEISKLPFLMEEVFKEHAKGVKFTKKDMINLMQIIENEDRDGLLLFFGEEAFGEFLKADVFDLPLKTIDFMNWFIRTHVNKQMYLADPTDIDGKKIKMTTHCPIKSYSVSVPTKKEYKKLKYAKQVELKKTKDEYVNKAVNYKTTEDEQKWNKDNREEWTPLTIEQLQEQHGQNWQNYAKYVNEDFYKMKQDKNLFTIYKESLKFYLQEQEAVDNDLKSWYDVPVIQQDALESKVRMVNNVPDILRETGQKISSIWNKNSTQVANAHSQLEGDATKKDYDLEGIVFDNGETPSLGMFGKVPIDRVSRNIFNALYEYSLNAEDFHVRKNMDEVFKPLLEIMEKSFAQNHKGQKNRIETIKKLRSQNILKEIPDNLFNKPIVRRVISGILTLSGLKLTMDGLGGALNFIQANSNNITEAFANKHLSIRNYVRGSALATELLASVTADFGKSKNLRFWTQMLENFDFIQGEFTDDISGRTSVKAKFFNIGNLLLVPRTGGEIHAQSAMALGMMDKKLVMNEDGKEYPVYQMYEIKDGELSLKEGFPKEWEIGGKEFLEFRTYMHSVNMELHGNYADINQTELSRHGIGKLVESMKRWYTIAVSRKLALTETFDTSTNTWTEGYYVTTVKALGHILGSAIGMRQQSLSSTMAWYASSETKKKNLMRAGVDISVAFMMYMFYTLVLGWDFDDDEKLEKVKKKSYFSQMLLVLSLRAASEQTSLIPFPGFGFQEMKRNLLTPWSLGSDVVSNAFGITELLTKHMGEMLGADFSNSLYYSKNTGAFLGDKGDAKIWRYMIKMFGYTGAQYEPDYWLKNWVNAQGRLK